MLQATIIDGTLKSLVSLYLDRAAHDPANLSITLKQFQLRFDELVAQEELLSQAYNDSLTKLY
jgi:hypothetical protein